MEALEDWAIGRLREHISEVEKINRQHGIPQENFVMEESSEFAKEYLKLQRDKSIQDAVTSEAIDLLPRCWSTSSGTISRCTLSSSRQTGNLSVQSHALKKMGRYKL